MTSRMLPLVLAAALILSLALTPTPVAAQPPATPKWSLEPSTIHINPCKNFTLAFWIRDIPEGWAMTNFEFKLEWDPALMEQPELPYSFTNPRGWGAALDGGPAYLVIEAWAVSATAQWTTDASWFEFKFHCLHEGVSEVILSSPPEASITLVPIAGGQSVVLEPDPFEVIVTQVEPAPVGGVVVPTNKLEIVTPYLALAGLVAAVSTVMAVKKRRET